MPRESEQNRPDWLPYSETVNWPFTVRRRHRPIIPLEHGLQFRKDWSSLMKNRKPCRFMQVPIKKICMMSRGKGVILGYSTDQSIMSCKFNMLIHQSTGKKRIKSQTLTPCISDRTTSHFNFKCAAGPLRKVTCDHLSRLDERWGERPATLKALMY